jgi:spermidine/putrescine transport system permease protein
MNSGWLRPYLLIVPSTGLFVALFLAPFLYFFVVSFWQFKFYTLVADPTTANYQAVWRDYLGLGLYTIGIATIVALCSLVVGFLYAYLVRFRAGRLGPLLLFIALISLFGGYLMKIYAWRTILGTEGIINGTLIGLGIIDQPLTWLLYNPPAVVITLVHFFFPFSVMPLVASMRGIADVDIEAARDLGASHRRILLDHILPRCRTGIIAAFAIPFLLACGDWVTPILVGGRMTMLGNLISAQFGEFLNWPLGAAMSFSLLAAATVVIAAFIALTRLFDPR